MTMTQLETRDLSQFAPKQKVHKKVYLYFTRSTFSFLDFCYNNVLPQPRASQAPRLFFPAFK